MSLNVADSRQAIVYARFSTDKQSDQSIADQVRECEALANKRGFQVARVYSDQALSGASTHARPGLAQAMAHTAKSDVSALFVFSLDRMSRDLADAATLFKQLKFNQCALISVTEDEIDDMHLAIRGMISQQELNKIAANTKRGQKGRIKVGKHAGGHCFGYRNVPAEDGEGSILVPDAAQVEIVNEIFERYANGESPRSIAADLNDRGVPGPSHGKKAAQGKDGKSQWGQTTINGDRRFGTGILNNERYVGKVIFNRTSWPKDPATGKKTKRLNPSAEWTIEERQEQQIVSEELWQRVKDRQTQLDKKNGAGGSSMQRAQRKKRPRRLLSGLLQCSECGGGFSMISATHYGCSNARNKGEAICSNRKSIHAGKLEERVLKAVRRHLMAPELVEAFAKEYRKQLHELTKRRVSSRSLLERELSDVEVQLSKLVDAVANGMPTDTIIPKVNSLNERKGQIESELSTLGAEPEVHIHPDLSAVYRQKVEELSDALDHEATKSQAKDLIRSLIDKVIMQVEGDVIVPQVHGDLAGILTLCDAASKTKPALSAEERASQVKLVAGARFNRYRTLIRVPI